MSLRESHRSQPACSTSRQFGVRGFRPRSTQEYQACQAVLTGRQLLELFFKNPALNVNTIMANMRLTRNTVIKYLQLMEDNRILYSNGKERYVMYFYDELFSLL